jgi:two-component system, cell cycle response regulator
MPVLHVGLGLVVAGLQTCTFPPRLATYKNPIIPSDARNPSSITTSCLPTNRRHAVSQFSRLHFRNRSPHSSPTIPEPQYPVAYGPTISVSLFQTMNQNNLSAPSLWSRPDPVLAHAGVAGEFLVAKIRLCLATLLLLIPLIDSLFFPADPKEALVGLSLSSATFLLSAAVYILLRREYNPSWLSFATTSFDVTFVSAGLALFLVLNEPHTAVNSKVVFEGYFLAIASTSLRYDKRVCITAGLLAFVQYFAIVYFAATHWALNDPKYAPYRYGLFGWGTEISRLIMMLTASLLSLALVARSQRLLQLATSDPLTGLFNRGYVDDRFAVELGRARRYRKQLTIAVIDADRFKSLNDTHGHIAGDLALRKLASVLRDSFRQSDTVGRYGGEEFVVILPEIDLHAGHQKLDSVRQLIANTPISLGSRGGTVNVTISAGLASFPEDCDDAELLFALADQRMFQAKRDGRNRVVSASTPVPATPPDSILALHQ